MDGEASRTGNWCQQYLRVQGRADIAAVLLLRLVDAGHTAAVVLINNCLVDSDHIQEAATIAGDDFLIERPTCAQNIGSADTTGIQRTGSHFISTASFGTALLTDAKGNRKRRPVTSRLLSATTLLCAAASAGSVA